MQKFWRLFKLPIIATAIALVVGTVVGIVMITSLHRSGGAGLEQRAQQLGQGLAIVILVLVMPFWFYAMWEAGKENREALKKANAKAKAKPGTAKKKPKSAR